MYSTANKINFAYDGLDDAFPPCDPGIQPFGQRVLIQIRTPKKQTAGGIILPDDIRETELANTQVGKVIAVGEIAFKNRNTMEPWPEGSWCKVGDYVRVPRFGGDRFTVPTADGKDEAVIVIWDDLRIIGLVTGDPLAVKAFL